MNRFILTDTKLCIGCRTCEVACVLAHNGEDVEAIELQDFSPRLQVIKDADVTGAVMCRHCEDAPCASSCPNDAITHEADTIQVDQQKCIGCKTCSLACPYGAMTIKTRKVPRIVDGQLIGMTYKSEAQKCDLCITRAAGPACVESCPTNALYIVEPAALKEMKENRQKAALKADSALN